MLKWTLTAKCGFVFAALLIAGLALTSRAALAGPCDGPAEQRKVVLMADWLIWAAQAPMIAAQQKGYYKEEGLDVEIIAPINPADTIKLVAAEKVTIGMPAMLDPILARETGIPVIAVAAAQRETGSGLGLLHLQESGFKTPADLKGKTIGSGVTFDQAAKLRTMLKTVGLTEEDVNIVDPGYAAMELLIAGKLDAALGGPMFAENPRFNEALPANGLKAPVQFFPYQDWGVPRAYFILLVVSENWAKDNPNTVCRFLRASQRGAEAWKADSEPVVAELARQSELFTLENHRAMSTGSMDLWQNADGQYWVMEEQIFAAMQDWLAEEGAITLPLDPSEYFTNEYLPN